MKSRKILGIVFVIAIFASMLVFSALNVSAADVVIAGTGGDALKINLTSEKIFATDGTTSAKATVKCYSIDGGNKWTASTDFDTVLPKLLTKDVTILVSTTAIATEGEGKGKPTDSTKTTIFAKINKRPATPAYSVDYRVVGAPGAFKINDDADVWTLVKKGDPAKKFKAPVPEYAEVVIKEKGKDDAVVQNAAFFTVKRPTGTKAESTTYSVSLAPVANSDGSYTAASKSKDIKVSSLLPAPKDLVAKGGEIKVPKGALLAWGTAAADGAVTSPTLDYRYVNGGGVFDTYAKEAKIQIRIMPTPKKPGSVLGTVTSVTEAGGASASEWAEPTTTAEAATTTT